MTIKLGINIASIKGQRLLNRTSTELSSVYERLATGQRINSASDDPAGLAISSQLRADSRVYKQGVRNINDGLSVASIVEGALQELSNILSRQMELAQQAANGVYSEEQRELLHNEANALVEEYNRILATTEFNGQKLLNNSNEELRIQMGYGLENSIAVDIGSELNRIVGSGTYTFTATFIGNASRGLESADFDGDGNLDLVSSSDTSVSRIYFGNGDGTFSSGVVNNPGFNTRTAEIADLNGDGFLDIVYTGVGVDAVGIRLGNGDGTFEAATSYAVATTPMSVIVGDFNNDGIQDLSTVGSGGDLTVDFGVGDGTFSTQVSVTLGGSIREHRVADLNGDGNLDVVTVATNEPLRVSFGNGDGTFEAAVSVAYGGMSAVAIGDVTGDGIDDIIFGSYGGLSGILMVVGNGDGTFSEVYTIGISGGLSEDINIKDVNGDGINDVFYLSRSDAEVRVAISSFNGIPELTDEGYPGGASPFAFVVEDFDGDGINDVVVSSRNDGRLRYYVGDSDETNILPELNLLTTETSQATLDFLYDAQNKVSAEIGNIGAFQARLEIAHQNLQSTAIAYDEAAAKITDIDVATEVSEMIRLQILQQAATAVVAQANFSSNLVLQLLEQQDEK